MLYVGQKKKTTQNYCSERFFSSCACMYITIPKMVYFEQKNYSYMYRYIHMRVHILRSMTFCQWEMAAVFHCVPSVSCLLLLFCSYQLYRCKVFDSSEEQNQVPEAHINLYHQFHKFLQKFLIQLVEWMNMPDWNV